MEALTYKCPGCGSVVEFDPASGLFLCRGCGQYYKLKMPAPITGGDESSSGDYMDIRVYHCSSCGAEIMTNDVNVSTFCSYCGQSTILFDRISKEKRPEKIVPFKISKEEALTRAKVKFGKGKYIFTSLDEVTVDSVRGIYMPYWVYDANMHIEAKVDYKSDKGADRVYNANETVMKSIPLDASQRFNDDVSLELNPYHVSGAEDFELSYLSGFYADKSDVQDRAGDAEKNLAEEVKDIILDAVPGIQPRAMRKLYEGTFFDYRRTVDYHMLSSDFKCNSVTYMFLPVYFITFFVDGKTAIVLVNGQTGKVVGNIPINSELFKKAQMKDMIIWAAVIGIVSAILFRFMPVWWAAALLGIFTYSTCTAAKNNKKKFDAYYRKINSVEMFSLAKNKDKV